MRNLANTVLIEKYISKNFYIFAKTIKNFFSNFIPQETSLYDNAAYRRSVANPKN